MSITIPMIVMKDIMKWYSHPSRGYHNWEHIEDCLRRLYQYGRAHMYLQELEIAIVFHDCVYAPTSKHNEYNSAIEAMTYLDAVGASASSGQKVFELIMDTTHQTPARTEAGKLMQDIDLLGFADAQACVEAAKGIRHEFKSVPDEVYYPERIKILQWFLDKPSIYHTSRINKEFEQRARTNIADEIEQIRETHL